MANSQIKRYNLVLPTDIYDELEKIADRKGTTVMDILRRFIKLGLIAAEVEEMEDSALLIRQGDREREIILI